MTWIRTIPMAEADDKLRHAIESQKALYPKEYATPVHPTEGGGMSPELPLNRRQHEMITTMVSVTNRCVY